LPNGTHVSRSDHWVVAIGHYICRISATAMSDHFEGHFPDEAEENELGGPIVLALMILGMIVLLIWAFG